MGVCGNLWVSPDAMHAGCLAARRMGAAAAAPAAEADDDAAAAELAQAGEEDAECAICRASVYEVRCCSPLAKLAKPCT